MLARKWGDRTFFIVDGKVFRPVLEDDSQCLSKCNMFTSFDSLGVQSVLQNSVKVLNGVFARRSQKHWFRSGFGSGKKVKSTHVFISIGVVKLYIPTVESYTAVQKNGVGLDVLTDSKISRTKVENKKTSRKTVPVVCCL